MKIVIATSNRNKVLEIREKFSSAGEFVIVPLSDYQNVPSVIEDADTFSGNALKKARAIRDFTGEVSLADDSGLVVDALNGGPGVYSARYGGEGLTDEERYKLLLENMTGIEGSKRTARFICSIAVAFPDGREFVTDGTVEGIIAESPSGDNGFGYDPVFYIPDFNKTMAEIPLEEKNSISHRGRALDQAVRILSGNEYGR